MKQILLPLTCILLLLGNIGRGDDLPFFSPLREEIVNQITIATNTIPLDKKLISILQANLKLVDRTKPTLITGSASLGTLVKGLGKTSLSNTFLPILIDTRTTYLETIESETATLEERLADTIPGKAQTAAQTAIDKLAAATEDASTNGNITLSLKSLSKAAKALATADKSVAKAETAPPGANFLVATITESGQAASVLKPAKDALEAYYDSFSGEVEITGGEFKSLGGGRVSIRGVSLTAMVPGEGTHSLSLTNDTQGYALYGRAIVLNINAEEPDVESQETYFTIDPENQSLGTGTMTITLDLEAKVAWGTFTFTAHGTENTDLEVSVTGSFLIRLETYE